MKTIITPSLLEIQFCPSVASTEFYELLIQFGMNLAILLILSRALYFKWNRKPEYMFAQLLVGVIVFMICALLRWVQLGLGLVLGLFAIFSIIRFRTINIPLKEMVYLFMAVGISAVNALLPMDICLQWILFANIFLVVLTFVMEKVFFSNNLSHRTITFNNTGSFKAKQASITPAGIKRSDRA